MSKTPCYDILAHLIATTFRDVGSTVRYGEHHHLIDTDFGAGVTIDLGADHAEDNVDMARAIRALPKLLDTLYLIRARLDTGKADPATLRKMVDEALTQATGA